LQGLNKAETASKFGDEQVLLWRRSYDVPPPALEPSTRAASAATSATPPHAGEVPLTECLKDTVAACCPSGTRPWPRHQAGKRCWCRPTATRSAPGEYLDEVSDTEIVGLNIPNGIPAVYELDHS
jgi:2,3-bisphosphoglycerate-dependent phosphoglycerate mutase